MKFKVIKEEFPSEDTKNYHFNNHVVDPRDRDDFQNKFNNAEEYERAADKLASTPVRHVSINNENNDDVVGYIDRNGNSYIKHNKMTDETVVYKPDKIYAPLTGNRIITFYRQSSDKYERRKNKNFKSTIK